MSTEDSTEDSLKEAPASSGLLGSILGDGNASQRAWGLWDSVKTTAVKQAQEAQHQAQEAWKSYDYEAVRQSLVNLGKSATTYIDEADRRLEKMENEAVHVLQQRSAELVDRVKEATAGKEREGEVLFSGPERSPLSRLDAELMALHASPDQILAAASTAGVSQFTPEEKSSLLAKSAELSETHKSLVPTKLSEAKFWNSYGVLRAKLEAQDRRRKDLIHSHGQEEQNELEDWGSSDEDEPHPQQVSATKVGAKTHDDKSDSDWE